jgi:hypothetical protein
LDWDTFVDNKNNGDTQVSQALADFVKEKDVSFLAVMCTFTDNDDGDGSNTLHRQLALCATTDETKKLVNKVVEYLQTLNPDQNLQLTERSPVVPSAPASQVYVRVFDQAKVQASRKQVAPILLRYFTEHDGRCVADDNSAEK